MMEYVELDVRPILAAGGEPFGRIMETVASLGPGEGIRLLAPFRPAPLFAALNRKDSRTRTGRSAAESGKCCLLRRQFRRQRRTRIWPRAGRAR